MGHWRALSGMEIPQNIEELILAEANLERDGTDAFRQRDFQRCIELMTRLVDRERKNWQARYVLAAAHCMAGDFFTASTHFRYLQRNCPNAEIRAKAKAALAGMTSGKKS
jgi:Flp pilus assembly protein TadD